MVVVLHLNMVMKDAAQLEKTFWEVSDPFHARYGQHLSLEALTKLVGSTDESLATVTAWLTSAGAVEISVAQTRDMIKARMSCAAAERVSALLPSLIFQCGFATLAHTTPRLCV